MARDVVNLVASVHQRLLNRAKASGRPFDELLQRFAIERFLYRLSKSRYADSFVLANETFVDFLFHIHQSLALAAEQS